MIWSLCKGEQAAGRNPVERDDARVADARHAAAARQLGPEAAGRLSLGLRLQRAGRSRRTSSRRTSRRPAARDRRWRTANARPASSNTGDRQSRSLAGIAVWWLVARRLTREAVGERRAVAADESAGDRVVRRRRASGSGCSSRSSRRCSRCSSSAYSMRMHHAHGWCAPGTARRAALLWLNTVLLVLAQRRDAVAATRARPRRPRGSRSSA